MKSSNRINLVVFEKLLIFIFIILLSIPFINAEDSETLHWAYCNHMGYQRIANETGLYCIFEDNNYCNTYDFYIEKCGKEYIKPLKDRQKGESVYVEFEKCADGLSISKPTYLLEQPSCYKKTIWTEIINWFRRIL